MSRKSRSVGDIVPLNCGQLMTDLDLMQKQISELKQKVTDLGDAHSQQISGKTDEIGEKLHTLEYFISGICELLFNKHQVGIHVCPPPQHDVTANLATKREGPVNEEGNTVGQKDPKKHRNDAEQSPDTKTQN